MVFTPVGKNDLRKMINKEKVEKELTDAVIYFEFEHRLIRNKTESEIISMCLFHASLIPMSVVAERNGVTKNISIWYNAYVVPLLQKENITYRLGLLELGGQTYFFKAHLSDLYISQNCIFR